MQVFFCQDEWQKNNQIYIQEICFSLLIIFFCELAETSEKLRVKSFKVDGHCFFFNINFVLKHFLFLIFIE